VLTTDHEYGACERVWRFLARERGFAFAIRETPLPLVDEDAWLDAFWAGVTPRTRLIFASHISSPTALTFPVAKLCARARKAGILTLIDGAHAPGQLDLDLGAIGADYYTGNCHKWLCAPKGSAFLYARQEAQAVLEPLVVSWGWESDSPGPSRFQDLYGWTGTADPSAYLSVVSAIRFQRENDWPKVRKACRELLGEASERIMAITGYAQLSSEAEGFWTQMRAFELSPGDPQSLQRILWERYAIEVPLMSWKGRRLLRVSIQAHNAEEDVDRLIEALEDLINAGFISKKMHFK
jgi:isopenicillin-N epimerase